MSPALAGSSLLLVLPGKALMIQMLILTVHILREVMAREETEKPVGHNNAMVVAYALC